ncbi:MAG: 4-hydroxy-tetrahydrodipicolinate synthase [Clostridiales bacterium]|nr:4-hydroxy-tetrahydrodipicolinate synthase [Clostridiales bacterium]
MKNPIFKGCGTALITPFADGAKSIDFGALERLIDRQISDGINALIILGTTGEAATLSVAEKSEVIRFAADRIKGRVPLVVGTGSNDTETAVANSVNAERLGAEALLVVTPYYNKCTQSGLVSHFKAVADSVGLPVIAYNVPGRTGVNILPATFAKMCEHKNISAIKEASGNMDQISEICRLARGNAYVYSGDDGLIVPTTAVGGIGVISVASNIAPGYFAELAARALNGENQKAQDMQLDALPLIKALFSEVNPIPVKAAARILGLAGGALRPPLTEIEEANLSNLKTVMRDFPPFKNAAIK